MVELTFDRKKYFSPFCIEVLPNFQIFLSNFRNLHAKIIAENNFNDFNARSQFWWPDGESTPEGPEIEHLLKLNIIFRNCLK